MKLDDVTPESAFTVSGLGPFVSVTYQLFVKTFDCTEYCQGF
jgi:hypothetical protein